LQFPPLRLVVEDEVDPYSQVEGVYHFEGTDKRGAPRYRRAHGVGTGAEQVERFLFSAHDVVPGRWYISDHSDPNQPVQSYADVHPSQVVPPGFEETADADGLMGQEHATWYKWDGETWAQTQMHLRVATPVTCGSTLKLQNLRSGHKLHAFPKMVLPQSKFKVVSGYANWYTTPKYEGGSERADSYWRVSHALRTHEWEKHGYLTCGEGGLGKPLRHKSIIRLQHANSGFWLHSGWHPGHEFKSPLSKQQEVSAAGNGTADYDFGDNWLVEIPHQDGFWVGDSEFQLKHLNTGCYLSLDEQYSFPPRNGEVSGQREVACSEKSSDKTKWRMAEGLYFPPSTQLYEDSVET